MKIAEIVDFYPDQDSMRTTASADMMQRLAAAFTRSDRVKSHWDVGGLVGEPTTLLSPLSSNPATGEVLRSCPWGWCRGPLPGPPDPAARSIRMEKGGDVDLDEFLQGLALRSKEPPAYPDAVNLLTIYASKGLEFDYIRLVGLEESVLPSLQSLQPNALPPELEDERRNCFVAITGTKKTLVLSRAGQYRGLSKQPSRFIAEMGFSTG